MNSGTIVQSRDQVLSGSRLPLRPCLSTLVSSRSSTYGPLRADRLIVLLRSKAFLSYFLYPHRLAAHPLISTHNADPADAGAQSRSRTVSASCASCRPWPARLSDCTDADRPTS